MKKVIVPLMAVTFLLSACVGKNYKRPEIELPDSQTEQTIENKDENINKNMDAFINEQWWTIFKDETLNKFEEEAIKYNHDLKSALERVNQAKANLTVAKSNYYPIINLFGQVTDSKMTRTFKDSDIYMERFSIGLSASYEIDLWGKFYRNAESAKANYLSSKADKDAVKLTLTATVAQAYFQMIALDTQLQIAKETLKSREDSYNVYNNRFKKGVISEFDLRRVEAEMESVRADVYSVEQLLKQAQTALSVLVGRNPKNIVKNDLERGNTIKDMTVVPEVPTAVPSDLISGRPDLKACEYSLESVNANVSVAKAALFPTISLTGKAGFASHELKDLFSKDEDGKYRDTWSYSGDIFWPIFAGGRDVKTYQAKKAEYQQMLEKYHKTIQNAFKEVLDSINNYSLGKNMLSAKEKQTIALQKAYMLAVKREKAGLTDLLDVLDVERMLLQSEMALVSARTNQLNAVVDICRALGGGWKE